MRSKYEIASHPPFKQASPSHSSVMSDPCDCVHLLCLKVAICNHQNLDQHQFETEAGRIIVPQTGQLAYKSLILPPRRCISMPWGYSYSRLTNCQCTIVTALCWLFRSNAFKPLFTMTSNKKASVATLIDNRMGAWLCGGRGWSARWDGFTLAWLCGAGLWYTKPTTELRFQTFRYWYYAVAHFLLHATVTFAIA